MNPIVAEEPVTKISAETSERELIREADKSERLWIIAIGAMVVIQLWFGLIATSFRLDETATWWVVEGSAAEAARRSFYWSGQSPLYYWIAWLSSRLFGLNEISLRIPSVLAMCGAIYFLYRVAERLYDKASARLVAFAFICVASFYAIDARPYALALFLLTASTWALLRWLDGGRPVDAVIYVLAGAGVVYAHCIMALGLGATAIYGISVLRKEPRRWIGLGSSWLAMALLCVPLLHQLKLFYGGRSAHTYTVAPSLSQLLDSFLPGGPWNGILLGVWIYTAFFTERAASRKRTGLPALASVTWSLFPQVFLFLLAVFSDLRLFVPRYYSSALPGQALLLGGLIASLRPGQARQAVVVALALMSIMSQGRIAVGSHGTEDWRTAMQFVNREAGSQIPVLVTSGFVEAADFASLRDPGLRDVLFAPQLVYGGPAKTIRLPNAFPGRDHAEMENVARQLEKERRFFLMTENPDRSYETWVLGRLGSRCSSEQLGQERFGYVWLTRFTCQAEVSGNTGPWSGPAQPVQ